MFKKSLVFILIVIGISMAIFSVSCTENEEVVEAMPEVVKVRVFIDSGHGVNYERGEYPLYPSEEIYSYMQEAGWAVYDKNTSVNFTAGQAGEMAINWSVATKLFKLLQADDRFEVILDRDKIDDIAQANVDRAVKANEWDADIRICIHAERASFRGYFVAMPPKGFYLPDELGGYYTKEIQEKSEEYATILLEQLDQSALDYGRSFDNGYLRNEYGYIMYRFSKHPVVVLEMDGATDWSKSIKLDSVQEIIADSIYKSLKIYFCE